MSTVGQFEGMASRGVAPPAEVGGSGARFSLAHMGMLHAELREHPYLGDGPERWQVHVTSESNPGFEYVEVAESDQIRGLWPELSDRAVALRSGEVSASEALLLRDCREIPPAFVSYAEGFGVRYASDLALADSSLRYRMRHGLPSDIGVSFEDCVSRAVSALEAAEAPVVKKRGGKASGASSEGADPVE